MRECPASGAEPRLSPGQTWVPRGQGLAREITNREHQVGGETLVKYRTKYGDFVTSEGNFLFWITRLSAALADNRPPS